MTDVFPTGKYENWGRCNQLLPHITSFYATSLADTESSESWAHIVTQAAWYFWERGNYDKAKRNIDLAIRLKTELFGAEDRRTLCSMEILASALMSLGNHVEAEHLHRYILRTLSKILGAHHPSVLTSMSNLALVLLLQQQKRHCESERPTRQVLEHSHQQIETLTTVNNLALVLNAQGRNKETEAHIRQALKGFRYRCGKRHPNTLTSTANLAIICRDQGSFTEAERLLRESLRWVQEQLGANHPST